MLGLPRRRTQSLGRDVITGVQRLERLDLVARTVGNVSARTPAGMVITPSRTPYASMRWGDLVEVRADGSAHGRLKPSTEWPLHLAVYRARPDAGAVVHTHSLHATAWSHAGGRELPEIEELRYYGIGSVTVTDAAPAGTAELGTRAAAGLRDGRAVLLGRHGVVTIGKTVDDAVVAAEVVERQAAIAWLLQRHAGLAS